jgi:hypothetical protein
VEGGEEVTVERWLVLWSLALIIPITVYIYRRREDSQWASNTWWVGLALILLMLYLLVFDPEPRGGRL